MNDRWPRTIHKDLFSQVFVKNPRTHLLSTAPVLAGSYMIMNPHYNRDATVPQLHRASTQDQHGRCTKPCHTRAAMGSAYAHISFFSPAGYCMYIGLIGPNEALMRLFCSATRRGRARDHTRLLRPNAVAHAPPPQARLHSLRAPLSSLSVFIQPNRRGAWSKPTRRVPRQYAASRASTPRPAPTKWVLPGTPG